MCGKKRGQSTEKRLSPLCRRRKRIMVAVPSKKKKGVTTGEETSIWLECNKRLLEKEK